MNVMWETITLTIWYGRFKIYFKRYQEITLVDDDFKSLLMCKESCFTILLCYAEFYAGGKKSTCCLNSCKSECLFC